MTFERSAGIELKLRIPPDELPRLLRHRALSAGGKPQTRHLVSTYFDTPDLRLMRNRVALRVRQDGDRRIQTVQVAVADGGPAVREDWQGDIAGDTPDLSLLDDRRLRKLLRPKKIEGRLAPKFVADIKRRIWPLSRNNSQLELAVDVGEITGAGGKLAVCEAQLGLKSGSIGDVYALARELRQSVPLVVEPRSKAERGYALVADSPPEPQRSTPIALDQDATLGEVFLKIGRSGLHQLRANEACMRAGRDPEAVHQYRVALRRLRSAFTTFRSAIPAAERRSIADDLRWLGRQFGRARELDVFITDLLAAISDNLPDDPAIDALARLADKARSDAYRRAHIVLDSPRYADLLLGLEAWWESGPWTTPDDPVWGAPALPFARVALRRLHRKLARLGGRLEDLSEEELHDFRLRGKKLRYASEFFRGLFREKTVAPYIAALAAMQDHLGSLNDSATTRQLLAELDQRRRGIDPELRARAAGVITGWISARVQSDLKSLPEAWSAFIETPPFWK